MAQPIQIILMRQLAGYLSVPLFLVGPNGDLLFYNEPAEAILGRRFDETGAMSAKESRSRKSTQGDKWSFCLTAGTLWPANQERP